MDTSILTTGKNSGNTEKTQSIHFEPTNRMTNAVMNFFVAMLLLFRQSFPWIVTGNIASVVFSDNRLRRYRHSASPEIPKSSRQGWLLGQSYNWSVSDIRQAGSGDDETGDDRGDGKTRLMTDGGGSTPPEKTEGEAWLTAAQIIVPCEEGNDLCLDDEFRDAWHEEMGSIRDEEAVRNHLAEEFNIPVTDIEFVDREGSYFARNDSQKIGHWRSRAAMVADIAASREIPEWLDMWEDLSTGLRGDILTTLRIFVDNCPLCDEPVTIHEESVDFSEGSIGIFAGTCEGCGSQLFEMPSPESVRRF